MLLQSTANQTIPVPISLTAVTYTVVKKDGTVVAGGGAIAAPNTLIGCQIITLLATELDVIGVVSISIEDAMGACIGVVVDYVVAAYTDGDGLIVATASHVVAFFGVAITGYRVERSNGLNAAGLGTVQQVGITNLFKITLDATDTAANGSLAIYAHDVGNSGQDVRQLQVRPATAVPVTRSLAISLIGSSAFYTSPSFSGMTATEIRQMIAALRTTGKLSVTELTSVTTWRLNNDDPGT